MITREPPTEPGQYWFRTRPKTGWGILKIDGIVHSRDVAKCFPKSEWCRIPAPDEVCEWKEDPIDFNWWASCGEAFCFSEDGPEENHMRFCPYCGRTLKAIPVPEWNDDEEGQE